jgi:hypothetical protein
MTADAALDVPARTGQRCSHANDYQTPRARKTSKRSRLGRDKAQAHAVLASGRALPGTNAAIAALAAAGVRQSLPARAESVNPYEAPSRDRGILDQSVDL